MIQIQKKTVLKKTKSGSSRTETITIGFIRKSLRKKKPVAGPVVIRNKTGWVSRELTEARNAIIEATFNNIWHTPLWGVISALTSVYLQYLLILLPGLSPVVATGAALFGSYIVAALLLSYLRRFTVWGAGKLKGFFRRK